jgi:hypothetical protein
MTLNGFDSGVERKVWENQNGTRLLTVSGLLETGDYEIESRKSDDGTVILECSPVEDN